jgi:hypothetical protein
VSYLCFELRLGFESRDGFFIESLDSLPNLGCPLPKLAEAPIWLLAIDPPKMFFSGPSDTDLSGSGSLLGARVNALSLGAPLS